LPVQRGWGKSGPEWQTGLWMLRARHLFLTPGDSPVGLRLPLQSLPWEPAEQIARVWTVDPMAPAGPLVVPHRLFFQEQPKETIPGRGARQPLETPAPIETGPVVRTAIAIEAREGRLYVFLPPLSTADDYVELLAAIEDTARRLSMPVLIEGYPLPQDARLRQIKVTPDPGVIEVNVHPAHSWAELVENTTALYGEARLSRLGSEKFMLDGRHTGTGGGNHVVLGGATA